MSGGYHTLFYFDLCEREREGGVTGVGEKEGEKGEEREKGIWIRERSRDRGSGLIAKILHQLYNYQNYQVYAVVDSACQWSASEGQLMSQVLSADVRGNWAGTLQKNPGRMEIKHLLSNHKQQLGRRTH